MVSLSIVLKLKAKMDLVFLWAAALFHVIHDFHNGGPLGRSGNEPHQSEASKATIFISESGRVEKHANVSQFIWLVELFSFLWRKKVEIR